MNKREWSIMLSALNNAAGYPMSETIEEEIGFPRNELHALHDKLLKDKNMDLGKNDSNIISSCLRVCLKYIDAWEFPATFDFEKNEVEKFYNKFIEDSK